jgi:hypothetical protein
MWLCLVKALQLKTTAGTANYQWVPAYGDGNNFMLVG